MKLDSFRTPFAIVESGYPNRSSWTVGEDNVKGIEMLGGGVVVIEFEDGAKLKPLVIASSGHGPSGEARSEALAMPRKVSGKK